MQNYLLIALISGLGGMLGWGFSEFATKKSVDNIDLRSKFAGMIPEFPNFKKLDVYFYNK